MDGLSWHASNIIYIHLDIVHGMRFHQTLIMSESTTYQVEVGRGKSSETDR